MKTWYVRVEYDCAFAQPDVDHFDVDAETIEEAAQAVWDEWHETGWDSASVSGHGKWGWMALQRSEFNFQGD